MPHVYELLSTRRARVIGLFVFILVLAVAGIGSGFAFSVLNHPATHTIYPPGYVCPATSHAGDISANCPKETKVSAIQLGFDAGVPFRSLEDGEQCVAVNKKSQKFDINKANIWIFSCKTQQSYKYIAAFVAGQNVGVWISNTPTFRIDFLYKLGKDLFIDVLVNNLMVGTTTTTPAGVVFLCPHTGLGVYHGVWFYIQQCPTYWFVSSAPTGERVDPKAGQRFAMSTKQQTISYQGYILILNPNAPTNQNVLIDIHQ